MNKETIEEIIKEWFEVAYIHKDSILSYKIKFREILEKHLLKEEPKKKIELFPMTDKRYINENTYNIELNSNNIIENITRIADFINNQ